MGGWECRDRGTGAVPAVCLTPAAHRGPPPAEKGQPTGIGGWGGGGGGAQVWKRTPLPPKLLAGGPLGGGETGMHWKGGEVPPLPFRAPSLRPATNPLTASASFNGI